MIQQRVLAAELREAAPKREVRRLQRVEAVSAAEVQEQAGMEVVQVVEQAVERVAVPTVAVPVVVPTVAERRDLRPGQRSRGRCHLCLYTP